MLARHKTVLGAVALAVVLSTSRPAHALQESLRGPFYIQGLFGAFAVQTGPLWGDYWHVDAEFGWHPSGRHDGFVVGVRQGFDVSNCSLGQTVARAGYDIAVPLRNGRFELTIAPYGVVGVDYEFPCGNIKFLQAQAGVRFGAGIEVKFFLYKDLYVLARPAETAVADYVNLLNPVQFYFNAGLGIGVGF